MPFCGWFFPLVLVATGCGGISLKTPSGVLSGNVSVNQGNRISLETDDGRVVIDKCEIESVEYPGKAAVWTGIGVTAAGLLGMALFAASSDGEMPGPSPLTLLPVTAGGLLTLGIGLEVKDHAKTQAGSLECGGNSAASASVSKERAVAFAWATREREQGASEERAKSVRSLTLAWCRLARRLARHVAAA